MSQRPYGILASYIGQIIQIVREAAAACIHMFEVLVPTSGPDRRKQGITRLWIIESPDAEKAMRGGPIDGAVGFGQRQHLHIAGGKLGEACRNAVEKLDAALPRQRIPSGVRRIQLNEVTRHSGGPFGTAQAANDEGRVSEWKLRERWRAASRRVSCAEGLGGCEVPMEERTGDSPDSVRSLRNDADLHNFELQLSKGGY